MVVALVPTAMECVWVAWVSVPKAIELSPEAFHTSCSAALNLEPPPVVYHALELFIILVLPIAIAFSPLAAAP